MEADDLTEHLRQQVCKRDAVCQRCGENHELEIHRLTPHSEDDGSDPLKTLVSLCRPCHAVMHPDEDSFDAVREQAPLFPRPSAPDVVSRMRRSTDHVCERCLHSIPDCTDLVAYLGETDDRPLMLCKPCAGVLYDHDDSFDVSELRASHRFPAQELSERKTSALWTPHTNADPAVAVEWTPEPSSQFTPDEPPEPPTDAQVTESENGLGISTVFQPIFLSPFFFAPSYYLFWILLLPFFGGEGVLPIITALVPTYLLGVVLLALDRLTDETTDVEYLALLSDVVCGAIGLSIAFWPPVSATVWFLWGIPLVSLIEFSLTVPALLAGIVFSFVWFSAIAALYARWKTESAVSSSLILKMIFIPTVLFSLLIALFTAVFRIIERAVLVGLAFLGSLPDAPTVAWSITTVLLVVFVLYEIRHFGIVEQYEGTTPTSPAEAPKVYSTTTTVAAQLDIPVPTIALSERGAPEAIAVGYRPANITLILSQGVIDALDDEELEAVIAHELAHVANMDAMVISIASLPIFFADTLYSRMEKRLGMETGIPDGFIAEFVWNLKNKTPHNFVWFMIQVVAWLTKLVSRPFVSALSRARETAADRTAAVVTGSPAALASALRTLDEQIKETPDEDLRELSSLSTLSILPLSSTVGGLFGTHPSTESRIAMLSELEAEQEQQR